MTGLLAGARWVWNQLPATVSTPARTIVLLLLLTPMWLGGALVVSAGGVLNLLDPVLLVAWATIATAVALCIAVAIHVDQTARHTRDELERAESDLRREVARLNAQLLYMQTAIARALHGPVQDAVSLGIRRLQEAHSDEERASAANTIVTLVGAATTELARPGAAAHDLSRFLSEFAELWHDLVTITVIAEPRTYEALGAHPVCSHTLIELVRELCGNAIRHGDAQAITVEIETPIGADVVSLTVTNNGKQLTATADHGVGSAMLDDLCSGWTRENTSVGVSVRATIPLPAVSGAD
jgi:signal transduction histidine kinase